MNDTFIVLGGGTAGLISAVMLREKYPFSNIKIIKSNELGIIGVGEGSTEHFAELMRFIGINNLELVYKTKATIKIGILFEDWNLGTKYAHSVGPESLASALWKPEIYNFLLLNSEEDFSVSPHFRKTYYENEVILKSNLNPSNQFHFDTFALNQYFCELCEQKNIQIIDGLVVDVGIDHNGYVEKLKLSDNTEIHGDFFIDCSGFKRVLSSKIGVNWKDYSDYLPMNHAIAFPTNHDSDNYEPYTKATALKNGWAWKIPTQERYGNGYVFCDNFINSEQALEEFSKHLNKNIESVARDIKFKAGRVDKFWHKNVLNIGLSSSFVEPLEAQSIGFTIIQMFQFLKSFDRWKENHKVEMYNENMIKCFDNIVDYIQLHYIVNRDDSDFWKSKCFKLTDFNKEELPVLQNGVFDYFVVDNSLKMFNAPNFYQIIAGLNLFDKKVIVNNLQKNRETYNNRWSEEAKKIHNQYSISIKHKEFIDLVKFNYLSGR